MHRMRILLRLGLDESEDLESGEIEYDHQDVDSQNGNEAQQQGMTTSIPPVSSARKGKRKGVGNPNPTFTKNDFCRLIALIADPASLPLLTKAFAPEHEPDRRKKRQALDAGRAGVSMHPWQPLADKFNDYTLFRPSHVLPDDHRLSKLSPCTQCRPLHPASTIKKKFSDIRSKFTICYNNHTASGKMQCSSCLVLIVAY